MYLLVICIKMYCQHQFKNKVYKKMLPGIFVHIHYIDFIFWFSILNVNIRVGATS